MWVGGCGACRCGWVGVERVGVGGWVEFRNKCTVIVTVIC